MTRPDLSVPLIFCLGDPRNGVRRTDRPPPPDHCENNSLTHHRTLSSVLSQIHRQVKDALSTPGKELFCLTINKNRGEEVKRYLTANTRFGRKRKSLFSEECFATSSSHPSSSGTTEQQKRRTCHRMRISTQPPP